MAKPALGKGLGALIKKINRYPDRILPEAMMNLLVFAKSPSRTSFLLLFNRVINLSRLR